MIPTLITLEEHFFTAEIVFQELSQGRYVEHFKHFPNLREQMEDIGELRLRDMEAGKVSFQVISHGPGFLNAAQCRAANDQLAKAVAKYPSRFAGFAVLPMKEPETAAEELRRCKQTLGFVGALIDNHAETAYYDGDEYHPFWAAAQELDTPIYLHPTWPTGQASHYEGNYSPFAASSLGANGYGWHSDVALHVLKLYASGLFERFPKVKIIIGHFGETLPFMLERIDGFSKQFGNHKRSFKQVWDENIWITTSGVWSLNPLVCILRNTKIDHILYSVDYPFTMNGEGLKWMEDLEKSGLVSRDDLEAIAYKNTAALLGVKVPQ